MKFVCMNVIRSLTNSYKMLQNAPNFFKNLRNLQLFYCNVVTKKGIDALMTPSNCITELEIRSCSNLTLTNAEDWHLQAKKENWNLSISFYNSLSKFNVFVSPQRRFGVHYLSLEVENLANYPILKHLIV